VAHGEGIHCGPIHFEPVYKETRCNVRLPVKYFQFKLCSRVVLQSALLFSVFCLSDASAALKMEKLDDGIYAYVGEQVISVDDYKQALQNAVRGKFYHGKIPEGKMEEVQKDTGKKLITNILILQEAQRRNYRPDKKIVQTSLDATVKKYEKQYGNSEKWPEYKARFIPRLKEQLEKKNIVMQLEEDVSKAPLASAEDSRKYYHENKEKFTSPEQLRVSVILLQVMPSSPVSAWDEAMDEGRKIYRNLQGGADFAELAKLHSADASAKNGGDMGYLHKGMLAKKIQDVLDKMKLGEISKPVELLRGIAIFRLEDRKKSVLNPYEKVKDRAGRLWQRDQAELARKKLVDRLWESTLVRVNSKYYQDDVEKLVTNVKK